MSKNARKWLERGKSLLIVALSCSAVLLLLNTSQDSFHPSREGWFDRIQTLLPGGETDGGGAVLLTETVRPVRMAITTELGRYGVEYDDEKLDELFETVNPLLTESMAACGPAQKSGEDGWRTALESPGIYFDFLGEVPLSALSAPEDGGLAVARRVLLTVERRTARLWYWNEVDETPYFCSLTDTLREQLEEVLALYANEGGGSLFAYEREDYHALPKWQLITNQTYTPQVYQAANPLAGSSELLSRVVQAVGFNPHSLYTVSGDRVVKDGAATLRIRTDGRVSYTAGADTANRLPVAGSEGTAAPAEAIEAARELLEQTLGQVQSAARYYLISCESVGETLEVRFGYLLDGAAVRLGGSGVCASFTVTGREISAFTLHFRSYTATETTSLVLPLQQAIANMLAVNPEGGELLLCYPDTGVDGPIQATWSATLS